MNLLTIPLVIVLSLLFSIVWTALGFVLLWWIHVAGHHDDEENGDERGRQ